MKLLLYTDVHWSQFSSVIRDNGEKYSVRLEQLTKSINWAEQLADKNNCDKIICLGDFFDAAKLNSQEISSLSNILWSKKPHIFIVGNHEITTKDRDISSLHILKLLGFDIITEPTMIDDGDNKLCFLPYMFEYPSIADVFPTNKNRIVFSHNDIEGVVLGGYTFDKGFSLDDIKENCSLFLNGHIHSKGVYDNMINIGNLCGQNFSENSCPHNAYILDTETLELQEFENPYSFNFYKINCMKGTFIPKTKPNPCLLIHTTEELLEDVRERVKWIKDLVYVRYQLTSFDKNPEEIKVHEIEQIDHIGALQEFVLSKLGDADTIKEELQILVR